MNEHTDTSLTDYALNELDPAARREVERRLAADPAAQHDVEEIAGLAGMLRQATAGGRQGDTETGRQGDKQTSLREALEVRLAGPVVGAAAIAHRSPPRRWVIAAIGGATTLAASTLFILSNIGRESDTAYLSSRVQSGYFETPGDVDADGYIVLDTEDKPLKHEEVTQLSASRERQAIGSGVTSSVTAPATSPPALMQRFNALSIGRKQDGATPQPGLPTATAPQLYLFGGGAAAPPAGRPQVVAQSTESSLSSSAPVAVNGLSVTGANQYGAGTLINSPTPVIVNGGTAGVAGSTAPTTPAAGAVVTSRGTAVRVDVGSTNIFSSSDSSNAMQLPAGTLGESQRPMSASGNHGLIVSDSDPGPSTTVGLSANNFLRGDGFDEDLDGDGVFGRKSELQRGATLTPERAKKLDDARMQLFQLSLEHTQLLGGYGPKHPRIKEIELRIQAVNQYVEGLESNTNGFDTEAYDAVPENAFLKTVDAPLSTFSIDVDTASYSNVRRILTSNQLPPPGAVRLEEFINYFTYDYPTPTGDDPFAVTTEAARCPWNADHVLVRVGLKGREIDRRERPATNLVFLVDVSGSMDEPNKLPLVRESLKLMTRELGDSDRVAIVVYAGSSGLVLDSTGGHRKQTIIEALDRLQAGGSTNGAEGIQLAYQVAASNFIKGGVNRVVLATDGDFNVGVTSQDELVRLIEEKAKTGVFFSALGYGFGNLKDSTLEKLADKGNGNYAYIDTLAEAHKVLVEQMSGTLVTIAKDVKIQIEFNPARVAGYRLLGYENRVLAAQDFNDDKKDAGEIGAGHTVTALYELIPTGKAGTKETAQLPAVDPLKYQQPKQENELTKAAGASELMTLKLRYKQPDGDVSKLIERPLKDDVQPYAKASGDFKFAAAVTAFGMLLRRSHHAGSATYDAVLELAGEGVGRDEGGYRKEFVELVRKAKELSPKR